MFFKLLDDLCFQLMAQVALCSNCWICDCRKLDDSFCPDSYVFLLLCPGLCELSEGFVQTRIKFTRLISLIFWVVFSFDVSAVWEQFLKRRFLVLWRSCKVLWTLMISISDTKSVGWLKLGAGTCSFSWVVVASTSLKLIYR